MSVSYLQPAFVLWFSSLAFDRTLLFPNTDRQRRFDVKSIGNRRNKRLRLERVFVLSSFLVCPLRGIISIQGRIGWSFLSVLDAYTSGQLVYEWQEGSSVNFVPGMALSQFDLMGSPYRNLTYFRREGEFSVLQVSFNMQRNTGYFLIQASRNTDKYSYAFPREIHASLTQTSDVWLLIERKPISVTCIQISLIFSNIHVCR